MAQKAATRAIMAIVAFMQARAAESVLKFARFVPELSKIKT
jgi:hypothetical protein